MTRPARRTPTARSCTSSPPATRNAPVRRLAVLALRNGSPQRDTILILQGLADNDDEDRQLRETARKVAGDLTRKSRAR